VIGKEELLGLSRLANLEIQEARVKPVLDNLQRFEQAAQALDAVALGSEDELGPEWRP